MHQRRGLQRVVGRLTAQVTGGQAAEFLINQGQHALARVVIAPSPIEEQPGHASGGG